MAKPLDTYEQWQADGVLEDRIKLIQDMVSRRILQKDICKTINLSEKTLIKLKKLYPRLNQAFINGDLELKDKLMDALFMRAVGMEVEEVQTIIEETSSGTKKKMVKIKKRSLPDFNAIKYLLVLKFGRIYNERREELDLLQRKLDLSEETWTNEYRDEEAFGVIRVRKQPKKQRSSD